MQTANFSNHVNQEVLEQAADWLVRMHADNGLTVQEQISFEKWRNASPENLAAWQRAESLTHKLQNVPAKLAMRSLLRPVDSERRSSIGKLAMLLLALPTGWGAWQFLMPQGQSFQYKTAVGKTNTITLDDGSKVTLNTKTLIDVYFDNKQRAVFLREGEIYIETAKDNAQSPRPFSVISPQGVLKALGTRFNVRAFPKETTLTVYEGAVELTPKQLKHAPKVIEHGHKASFKDNLIGPIETVDKSQAPWLNGMLLADNMSLSEFVSELARYYNGGLYCDVEVANIQIAGAFPVTDTQKSLDMLIATYPVTVVSRMDQYWVTSASK